jgi:hypothetical protein
MNIFHCLSQRYNPEEHHYHLTAVRTSNLTSNYPVPYTSICSAIRYILILPYHLQVSPPTVQIL